MSEATVACDLTSITTPATEQATAILKTAVKNGLLAILAAAVQELENDSETWTQNGLDNLDGNPLNADDLDAAIRKTAKDLVEWVADN